MRFSAAFAAMVSICLLVVMCTAPCGAFYLGFAPASAAFDGRGWRLVVHACAPGQQALEDASIQHGVFSYQVAQAIREAELPPTGLDLLQLLQRVDTRVSETRSAQGQAGSIWMQCEGRVPTALREGATRCVFVGVDEYNDTSIPDLRYCGSDAKLLAEALAERSLIGPEHCRMLTGGGGADEPAFVNILAAVDAMAREASPDDTLLFSFAGHGYMIEQQAFLVPADAKENFMGETSVPLAAVIRRLTASPAKGIIILLDMSSTAAPN